MAVGPESLEFVAAWFECIVAQVASVGSAGSKHSLG